MGTLEDVVSVLSLMMMFVRHLGVDSTLAKRPRSI